MHFPSRSICAVVVLLRTVFAQSLPPNWPSDVIADFTPSADLTIIYPATTVSANNAGVKLTPNEAADEPRYVISPITEGPFLLFMMDPDAPTPENPTASQILHMFRGDVQVQEDGQLLLPNSEVLTPYLGPGPPAGSNPHRYTFVLFKQPVDFTVPAEIFPELAERAFFNLTQFAQDTNLGAPIAGNFFLSENEANESVTSPPSLPSPTAAPGNEVLEDVTSVFISLPSQQEQANVTGDAQLTISSKPVSLITVTGALPTVGFRDPNAAISESSTGTSGGLVIPTSTGFPSLNQTGGNETFSNGSVFAPPVDVFEGSASRRVVGLYMWASTSAAVLLAVMFL